MKRAGSLRLILTLATAGLCSGIVLVCVFLATQPLIERNQAEALETAIFQVLPTAASRKAFVLRGDELAAIEDESALGNQDAVYAGYDAQGSLVGYGIPGEGAGFQDTIKLIFGFDPSQRLIVGMQVLESRETPGLGDKILKDQDFLENFRALHVDPQIVSVKHGAKTAANQVDAISGATISSKAIVSILNQSTNRWSPYLHQKGDPQ